MTSCCGLLQMEVVAEVVAALVAVVAALVQHQAMAVVVAMELQLLHTAAVVVATATDVSSCSQLNGFVVWDNYVPVFTVAE